MFRNVYLTLIVASGVLLIMVNVARVDMLQRSAMENDKRPVGGWSGSTGAGIYSRKFAHFQAIPSPAWITRATLRESALPWITEVVLPVAGLLVSMVAGAAMWELYRAKRIQATVDATAPNFDQILERMNEGMVVPNRLSRIVAEVKAQRGLVSPTASELVISIRIASQKMREARMGPEIIAQHQFAVGVKALILNDSERRALQLLSKYGHAAELKRTTQLLGGRGYELPTIWGVLIGRNTWRDWWEGGYAPTAK